jgi:hypothetical protein
MARNFTLGLVRNAPKGQAKTEARLLNELGIPDDGLEYPWEWAPTGFAAEVDTSDGTSKDPLYRVS